MRLSVASGSLLSLSLLLVNSSAQQPIVSVKLTSQKSSYVLGEPVVFELLVENVSSEILTLWSPPSDLLRRRAHDRGWGNVEFWISDNGGATYEKYDTGIMVSEYGGDVKELRPGEQWKFRFTVLYASDAPSALAFDKPGTLCIRADYPLVLFDPTSKSHRELDEVESNVVRVQIESRTPADEQIWSQIKSRETLQFLQVGWVQGKDQRCVWHAMNVFESQLPSAYHPALREALFTYYKHGRSSLAEIRKLEAVLELDDADEVYEGQTVLFPDDPRLDVITMVHVPDQSPLGEVLDLLSDQTRVRLDAEPGLRSMKGGYGVELQELRFHMLITSLGSEAYWIRKGSRYYLRNAGFEKAGPPRKLRNTRPPSQELAQPYWESQINDLVRCLAFSPDGSKLAVGGPGVRIWQVAALEEHPSMLSPRNMYDPFYPEAINSLSFHKNGLTITTAGVGGPVRIWDTQNAKEIKVLAPGDTDASSESLSLVAFGPEGNLLATDGLVLWDAKTAELRHNILGHTHGALAIAFSPDGRTLASAGREHAVKLWDVQTSALKLSLRPHDDWVFSVAFSPDGTTLASGSFDGSVRLWNTVTGRLLRQLEGHSDGVLCVALSPDGKTVASGGYDGTVRFWDSATGAPGQTFAAHASWVTSLAFSPRGDLLATGSHDGTIRLWRVGIDRRQ